MHAVPDGSEPPHGCSRKATVSNSGSSDEDETYVYESSPATASELSESFHIHVGRPILIGIGLAAYIFETVIDSRILHPCHVFHSTVFSCPVDVRFDN